MTLLQMWFVRCLIKCAVTCAFLAFLAASPSVNAEIIAGRVVAIADGDTITVLDATKTQHKIRLSGIDAPENAQTFGERSKKSLSSLVFNQAVIVETTKRDHYGRSVGTVLVEGVDVNLEQIKRGMAWHYKAYVREQPYTDRLTYAEAEEAAQRARLGLWNEADPVPPWEFRQSRGMKKKKQAD